MIDWLLVYGIGWQWWAALGVPAILAATLLLVRLVGLSRAMEIGAGLAAALGAGLLLRRARQQGWADRETKLQRDTNEAVADFREKQNEVAGLAGDELDRRAGRWVRRSRSGRP